jgi:hypothetical protein
MSSLKEYEVEFIKEGVARKDRFYSYSPTDAQRQCREKYSLAGTGRVREI